MAGGVVGNGHGDGFGELDLALLDEAVYELHHMEDLKGRAGLGVEALKGVVAVGAGGDDGFHSGVFPGLHVALGEFGKLALISHLVSLAAAAGLGLAHDADIYAGVLDDRQGGAGYRPLLLVEAEVAAGVEDDLGLFFGKVFNLEALGPFTAVGLGLHHHIIFVSKALDNRCVSRQGLAIADQSGSYFLDDSQRLHILDALAHSVAAAAHITFIEDIQQGGGILVFQFVVDKGQGDVHTSLAGIGVEEVVEARGADLGEAGALDLPGVDPLTDGAAGALPGNLSQIPVIFTCPLVAGQDLAAFHYHCRYLLKVRNIS